MLEEDKAVNVGWAGLNKSGKSLTLKVLDQLFFIPLGDLYQVLDKKKKRAFIKRWVGEVEDRSDRFKGYSIQF